jgi:hypothetical protein
MTMNGTQSTLYLSCRTEIELRHRVLSHSLLGNSVAQQRLGDTNCVTLYDYNSARGLNWWDGSARARERRARWWNKFAMRMRGSNAFAEHARNERHNSLALLQFGLLQYMYICVMRVLLVVGAAVHGVCAADAGRICLRICVHGFLAARRCSCLPRAAY